MIVIGPFATFAFLLLNGWIADKRPFMRTPIEPPARYWTRASIEQLATAFDLPNDVSMQDWAWEVADPTRTRIFVDALDNYKNEPDTQFTLMDVIFQSLEESETDLAESDVWHSIAAHLKKNYELHSYQIWYWSAFNSELVDAWRISPFLRRIWIEKHPDDK